MAYKPTLIKVNAFDAAVGTTFTFSWKGPQAFYNELIIKDSETLATVYQHKIKTMALRHVMDLSAGTSSAGVSGAFVNGRPYQAAITVYDKGGNACGTSDPVTFWCYSSPTFRISNLDGASNTVTMSSFYLNLYYSQDQGEMLKEYTVSIYDSGKNLLSRSPVLSAGSADDPLIYKAEGLTNGTSYYIKADGVTYHGIEITTGYAPLTVEYDRMGVGAVLTAKNMGDGTISISSHFKITNAVSQPDPAIYIDSKEIDLTPAGSYVDFFDGIDIGSDFELKARLRNVQDDAKMILKSGNTDMVISLEVFYPDTAMAVKKYYFRLLADGGRSMITTKLFSMPSPDQYIHLLAASKNGYYAIKMQTEASS